MLASMYPNKQRGTDDGNMPGKKKKLRHILVFFLARSNRKTGIFHVEIAEQNGNARRVKSLERKK